MAIELKYGNPAAVLGAAYASGVAQSEEERKRQMTKLVQQQQMLRYDTARRFQEHQWGMERQQAGFAQQGALQAREENFRSGENLLDRQARTAQQADLFEQQQTLQAGAFAQQRDLQQTELQQQQELNKGQYAHREELQERELIAEGLKTGALSYTPAERQWNQKVDAGIMEVKQDPKLDPQQRADAIAAMEARRINPSARPEDQPMPMADQLAKDTVEHPTYGLMGRDQNGNWSQVAQKPVERPVQKDDTNKVKFDQSLKLVQAKTKRRTELAGVMGEDGESPKYSSDEIDAMVGDEFAELDAMVAGGGESGAQPSQPPDQQVAQPQVAGQPGSIGMGPGVKMVGGMAQFDLPKVSNQQEFDSVMPGTFFIDTTTNQKKWKPNQ